MKYYSTKGLSDTLLPEHQYHWAIELWLVNVERSIPLKPCLLNKFNFNNKNNKLIMKFKIYRDALLQTKCIDNAVGLYYCNIFTVFVESVE